MPIDIIDEIRPRKEERATLRQRLFNGFCWLCALILAGLALGGCSTVAVAPAAEAPKANEIPVHVIEHHDGVRMKLLASPCVDDVSMGMAAAAPPQFADRWKAISSSWRMQDGSWREYAGCWLEVQKEEVGTQDTLYVLIFSDGQYFQLLKRDLFKPVSGV